MHIIQIASAVYVLVAVVYVAVLFVGLALKATSRKADVKITGFPAVVLYLSVVVCAVTTLAEAA